MANLSDERERVFQGALETVEPEACSDEVLVMMVLGTGREKRGQRVRHGTESGGRRTSSVCMSQGGGGDALSCDRIASKTALLYR